MYFITLQFELIKLMNQKTNKTTSNMACLVLHLKLTFLYFKQHYTHFHLLFHPHVFQKTINNFSQTTLPNTLLIS